MGRDSPSGRATRLDDLLVQVAGVESDRLIVLVALVQKSQEALVSEHGKAGDLAGHRDRFGIGGAGHLVAPAKSVNQGKASSMTSSSSGVHKL